jgi:formylglycine-generating enzyme required for sulfatase activity
MRFIPVPITGGPTGGARVLFSIWETRVQDYEPFVKANGREWPKPDFVQGPTHPAVMMTWDDAVAFCAWLTARERLSGAIGAPARYRLPTDHEWSCAIGVAGREDAWQPPSQKNGKLPAVYPWGAAWPPPPRAGNFAGEELRPAAGEQATFKFISGYHDPFPRTAPVGSFPADGSGLFDLDGNVHEWVEDLFDPARPGRVLRGGTWNSTPPSHLASAVRFEIAPASRQTNRGFRCVLDPGSAASAEAAPPVPTPSQTASAATTDAAFKNTLGL